MESGSVPEESRSTTRYKHPNGVLSAHVSPYLNILLFYNEHFKINIEIYSDSNIGFYIYTSWVWLIRTQFEVQRFNSMNFLIQSFLQRVQVPVMYDVYGVS